MVLTKVYAFSYPVPAVLQGLFLGGDVGEVGDCGQKRNCYCAEFSVFFSLNIFSSQTPFV